MNGRRALALGLAGAGTSQVLSSISNVVISMALARGAGAAGLGAFTIAFTVYLIVWGFQRSLISEPFHALPRSNTPMVAESRMAGAAIVFSAIAASAVATTGLLLGLQYLIALSVVLPAVILQDAARFIAFRRDRPTIAVTADALWVILSIAAWPIVSRGSAILAVVLWGGGGAVGAAVGLWLLRVMPAPPLPSVEWWWTHARHLGSRLAIAGAIYTVTDQLGFLAVALFVTDAALGELRAGQIVIQPTMILLAALSVFLLPRLADRRGPALYGRIPILISAAATAAAAVILAVTLLLLGVFERVLFGGGVAVVLAIVIPLGMRTIASAAAAGFVLALKADQQGDAFVGARLVAGLLGLVAIVVGAGVAGTLGAAWGMAFQGVLLLAMFARAWVIEASRTLRFHDGSP
jgi:O-antigen/teichoic acid export membrane protein